MNFSENCQIFWKMVKLSQVELFQVKKNVKFTYLINVNFPTECQIFPKNVNFSPKM